MNEMPFPKPPPANPLLLEEWLDRTDRAKVGREPFFRGREKEYDIFRRAVNSLRAGLVGGGTMIFQGAPGAGKSALMNECMEAVRCHSTPEQPWVAVSIRPGFLDSPSDVIELMVKAATKESERLSQMTSEKIVVKKLKKLLKLGKKLGHELSERGAGVLGFKVGGRKDQKVTVRKAFQGARPLLGSFHIVVFVDEAQNVPIEKTTRTMLDCLHQDPQGIPLVAAFFGLSDTEEVLIKCGLSRLPRGRLVNLERLPLEDAASAIRGVFDVYGFKGTSEDRNAWVDSLASMSQGWPQHVNSVSVATARIICEHGGRITMKYLDEALERGQEQMKEYYRGRLVAGSSLDWVYKRLAMAEQEKGGVLAWNDIDLLTETERARRDESTDEFLTNALHAGLLAPTRDSNSRFKIPIPSLGDYLRALPD